MSQNSSSGVIARERAPTLEPSIPIDRTLLHSTRCTAKSSRTGEQCKRWSVVGSTVCHAHGAAKGTPARRKADERKLLARFLADGQRRSPHLVIADALAAMDALARMALDQAKGRDSLTADELDQLISASMRAAQLGRMAIETGSTVTRIEQADADAMLEAFERAIRSPVANLDMAQVHALRESMVQELQALAQGILASEKRPELPAPPVGVRRVEQAPERLTAADSMPAVVADDADHAPADADQAPDPPALPPADDPLRAPLDAETAELVRRAERSD